MYEIYIVLSHCKILNENIMVGVTGEGVTVSRRKILSHQTSLDLIRGGGGGSKLSDVLPANPSLLSRAVFFPARLQKSAAKHSDGTLVSRSLDFGTEDQQNDNYIKYLKLYFSASASGSKLLAYSKIIFPFREHRTLVSKSDFVCTVACSGH